MTHKRVLWQMSLLLVSSTTQINCSPLTISQPKQAAQASSDCDYPFPAYCYTWNSLPSDNALSCDLDSVQQTSPNAILDPCPGWFRAHSLYPYQFQILPNEMASDSGEKIYAQFAQSKCYVKAAPNSAYPDRKSAILRSAVFRPNGCVKLQTSFWYRMSAAPILTGDRDKDYFLELVMHHSADNSPGFIPTWQIWGSTSDYADFPGPNVWNRVQTEYAADDQFTLNFYAHHGDTCNTTSIDLDGIDTKTAVVVLVIGQFGPVDCRPSPTSSSSATSTSTTAPESAPTTTPEVHTHEPDTTSALPPSATITPASEQCEVGPAVIARCSNGKVSMPSLQPDLSDANTAVFAGDNSYLCRTHLRSLQMWLLEKATKQLSPHKPVEVTCRRGVLEFSQSDPDTADAMVLQFRAVSVDMKCRIIFADFLAQLISVSASFY